MISYRDMTFCTAIDCQRFGVDCDRSLTEAVQRAADSWWGHGPMQAPICTFVAPPPKCYQPGDTYHDPRNKQAQADPGS